MKTRGFVQVNHSSGNMVLEILSRTSLIITLVYYPLVATVFIYLGTNNSQLPGLLSALIVGAGLIAWTLLEYVIHRMLYRIGGRMPTMAGFHNAIHGTRNNKFSDKDSALMPPVPGLVISLAVFGVNYSIMGWTAAYFTSGMVTGYVIYAWIHYNIHYKPPHPLLRFLWRHHTLHHFKYPDKAFGVSSPFWDIIFRTMPPKSCKKVESEHVYLN